MEKKLLKSLLVPLDSSIKEAIQRLNETGLKILFIIDADKRLLGTLTDGDIRRGIITGVLLTAPVESVMRRKFISLSMNTPAVQDEAIRLMQQHMIEHVPILNEEGAIIDVFLWVDFLSKEKSDAPRNIKSISNPVVIMAGGKGTRLDPFTKILPKPLIPIGNKPIIETIMDRFFENGFSRFILILNYKKEMIKAYFGEKTVPYDISFIEEEEFYGTAGGMALLRDAIRQSFIVTNCDTILEGNYHDFFQWHEDHKNVMTIIGSHREITVPYGVLCMNNGTLDKIDEKPKLDLFINTGTYVFDPSIFDFINNRQYLDMDKLISKVKSHHAERVGVYPHWGGWFDIGQWDEYRNSLKALGDV